MYFDTHIHLNSEMYNDDLDDVINRAHENGVNLMTVIGFDIPSSKRAIEIAETYDGVFAAVGIHPSDAKSATKDSFIQLKKMLEHPKVVALGEIGFDYYHDTTFNDIQKVVFEKQLEIAHEFEMPIVVHMRDSVQDVYDMLERKARGLKGVVHCYSGCSIMLKKFLDLGFYVGLDGPVTFKNAHSVHEIAKLIPLNRLVIETDGPYLTPTPFRGKRNEPSYVKYIAEHIAKIKEIPVEEVARITTENGKKLYRIE